MSTLNLTRGKGGRPRTAGAVNKSTRKTLNWISYRMSMANYLKDNYNRYKESTKRIEFLREMRSVLEIPCDCDRKLKSAFADFLKKYTDVKAKLNSSGFGVDPEKDKTLDKGWIMKACPYFEILDEVMGTRPNVTPPAIVSTSRLATESVSLAGASNDLSDNLEVEDKEENDCDNEENGGEEEILTTQLHEDSADIPNGVASYVKQAFRGLKPAKVKSKDTIGVYTEVMSERISMMAEIENKKMKYNEARDEEDLKVKQERNDIERMKVNSQMEIERQKLELEKAKFAERAAEREHELVKIRMQQEFELKKIELQLRTKTPS